MKKTLLICVCSVVLISTSAEALRFGAPPVIKIETRTLTKVLPEHNDSLYKALNVHNLMTELPDLQTLAEQHEKILKNVKEAQSYFDEIFECNAKRFSRFKNASEVVKKVSAAYKEQTKNMQSNKVYAPDSIFPMSALDRQSLLERKKNIEVALITDTLENSKKWGAEPVDKKKRKVPEDIQENLVGFGFEELVQADDSKHNMKLAQSDFEKTYKKMISDFVAKLSKVGIQMPAFDPKKVSEVRQVRKSLQSLKSAYLEEAKAYVEKLNLQDQKYPKAAARRNSRSKTKQQVLSAVESQFPEAFAEMQRFDQYSPQARQQVLIDAMEKDENGIVYLTETNAFEVEQKMAENTSHRKMVSALQAESEKMANQSVQQVQGLQGNFDFCKPL